MTSLLPQALLAVLPVVAGPAPAAPVTLDGLKSTPPVAWKAVETTSPMRFRQWSVPRADGDANDAEVVIFFFGPGQGGDAAANIDRWKKMFEPPAGKQIDEVSKVETLKIGKVAATVLDVRGTYLYKPAPMAPQSEKRPNHRMLSVVFESPQGPYFIRFVGPEKTIERNKKDFDKWLKAFK
jgi:hypothetical protein